MPQLRQNNARTELTFITWGPEMMKGRLRLQATLRSRLGFRRRSVAVAAASPFVVEADADDVVGQPAIEVRGEAGGGHRDGGLELAEVDIEVFDLCAPASPKCPFDAGARGPTSAQVVHSCDSTGRTSERGGKGVLDLAIGHAGRSVQQEIGRRQEAEARPGGAEPLELMVGRERRAGNNRNDRAAFLTGGLNVGFKAPHPRAELIVVTGLDAPDHAIEVLGFPGSDTQAEQRAVILRLTPAVANV